MKGIYIIFTKFTPYKEMEIFSILINGFAMDNYSISSFPNHEAERSTLIELKGELTLQYIQEIKLKIDQIIQNLDTVEILVFDATIIDLSMMQYLFSLKKSQGMLGKTFKITFEIDDDVKELLVHAGFKNIENIEV